MCCDHNLSIPVTSFFQCCEQAFPVDCCGVVGQSRPYQQVKNPGSNPSYQHAYVKYNLRFFFGSLLSGARVFRLALSAAGQANLPWAHCYKNKLHSGCEIDRRICRNSSLQAVCDAPIARITGRVFSSRI